MKTISQQVIGLDWEGWEHEARDWRGRWAKSGSAPAARAQQHIAKVAGTLHPQELDDYSIREYKQNTLNPAFHYTPEQSKAIHGYAERYEAINESSRSGHPDADAQAISSAMQPMPKDLILLREVAGQHSLDHVNPGDVIADEGFSSTTLRTGNRYASGRDNTTVMHIIAPAGTPAVWADPVSEYPEDEMILDRGQALVMVKKQPRPGRTTVTDAYFLAVPRSALAG